MKNNLKLAIFLALLAGLSFTLIFNLSTLGLPSSAQNLDYLNGAGNKYYQCSSGIDTCTPDRSKCPADKPDQGIIYQCNSSCFCQAMFIHPRPK